MHIFLFGGLKSHGPGAPDYPYWLDSWSKLLTAHGAVVDGAFSFPSEQQLAAADVVIIYKGDAGYMTPEQRARLQAYVKRGGGLVTFHDSLCGPDPEDMATLVGAGKKHGEVNYTWTATLDYNVMDKDSPIAQGMPAQIYDEAFYKLNFAPGVHPILTVTMPDTPSARRGGGVGQTIPQMWTYEHTMPGGSAPAPGFWLRGATRRGRQKSSHNLKASPGSSVIRTSIALVTSFQALLLKQMSASCHLRRCLHRRRSCLGFMPATFSRIHNLSRLRYSTTSRVLVQISKFRLCATTAALFA